MRESRKLRNFLVRAEDQLYYGLLLGGVTGVVNVGMLALWGFAAARPVSGFGLDGIAEMIDLVRPSLPTLAVAMILLALNVATAFALGIVVSHRTFGPAIPILRQLDRLVEGEYDGRIQLRQRDQFKDIAERINVLTATLAERDSSKTPDQDSPAA